MTKSLIGTGPDQVPVNGYLGRMAYQDPASVVITGGSITGTTINSSKVDRSGDTMTGNLTVPSINSGPLAGFRNAIINGNFDIWQRGTSGTTSYVADRWAGGATGSTIAQSRQAFTLGQTDVPNEPTYFHRTVVTSSAGASNFAILSQLVEDVRTFAAQTVTLSFWAKADASKNIAVEFQQVFGTGGSPSAMISSLGVTTCALTASWKKFSVVITLPSISGKTLGSDNNSNLRFNLWFDAGSSFNSRSNSLGQQSGTFDIAQVQLEAGPVATPFERRPIGTELALCQRYYCETRASARFYATGATHFNENHILWPVNMRATPTVTIISGGVRSNIFTSYPQTQQPSIYGARYILASNGVGDCYAVNDTITAAAEL